MRWNRERATDSVEFDVQVVTDGARPLVIVRGEVDLSNVDSFSTALDTAIAKCESAGTGIEIDLRDTTFMGSTGLTALIGARQRLGQVPEAVVLRDPSAALRRLLDLAGVGELFTLRETGVRVTSDGGVSGSPSSPPG